MRGVGWGAWSVVRRVGDPVEQILALAEELPADAIYMSTHCSTGWLARSKGDVTERVIEGAVCPVAAVPVG